MSAARARVLGRLHEQPDPVGCEELAREFDQHPNTVRNHLDGLVREGLVVRERVPGPDRGRPPWRYRINPDRPEADPRIREHQGLVIALAAHLAQRSPDPSAEARSAGQGWGRTLIAERLRRVAPGPADQAVGATPAAARREVVRLLADLEFAPRSDRDATRVVLTTCPLLDVARQHPEVVCAVHEGMVAGALAILAGGDPAGAATAPDTATAATAAAGTAQAATAESGGLRGAPSGDDGVRLAPFATQHGCVLTLPRAWPHRRSELL